MGKMKLRNESGKINTINLSNFALRLLQFLVGLAVLILYATQPSYRRWSSYDIKFDLGIAAGAMAVITTPLLAIIPFFVGYRFVAYAFVWDLALMAVYAATFAHFKKGFAWGSEGDYQKTVWHDQLKISNGHIDAMRVAVIFDFIGMLLWLITFLMAVVLLVLDRIRGGGRLK